MHVFFDTFSDSVLGLFVNITQEVIVVIISIQLLLFKALSDQLLLVAMRSCLLSWEVSTHERTQ